MKKVIALLLAGMLVLGASMTCFAAPSTGAPSAETGTTDSDKDALGDTDLAKVFKDAGVNKDANNFKKQGIYGKDTLPDKSADGYIYQTIKVDGLKEGSDAYIFAYIDGKWVDVTYKVETGKITGKFPKAAPYMVVVEKSVKAEGASPKTGDMAAIPMLIAAAAAAGVAVTTRRRIV